jgi:hypothetical protein
MTHTGIVGNLFAKFAIVHLNRVWLFNITIGVTNYPHMILACKFEDPTNWDSARAAGRPPWAAGRSSPGWRRSTCWSRT